MTMSSTSRQLVALNQSELAQFVSVVPSVLPYRHVSEPPPSVGDVFFCLVFRDVSSCRIARNGSTTFAPATFEDIPLYPFPGVSHPPEVSSRSVLQGVCKRVFTARLHTKDQYFHARLTCVKARAPTRERKNKSERKHCCLSEPVERGSVTSTGCRMCSGDQNLFSYPIVLSFQS